MRGTLDVWCHQNPSRFTDPAGDWFIPRHDLQKSQKILNHRAADSTYLDPGGEKRRGGFFSSLQKCSACC